MKILLAEDDDNISTISKLTLEKLGGHLVEVVRDGQQALDAGLKNQYDLILLDEMMPSLNGISVCRKLNENNIKTPVVFLSARSQKSDIELFESLGIGYISKPFDPAQLNNQILKLLKMDEG